MKRFSSILFLMSIVGWLTAQTDYNLDTLENRHPNSDGIFLKYYTDVNIEVDKNKGLLITSEIEEDRLFFNSRARLYSEASIHFSYHLKVSDVNAYSVIPGEKKPSISKVKDFSESNAYSSNIFYDDSKNLDFIYKGLQRGARTVLKYTEHENEPHFFGSSYMGSYFPIKNGRFKIEFPKDVKLNYQELNFEGFDVKFTKQENKKTTVFLWEFNNMPRFKYTEKTVGIAYVFPIVQIQIAEYVWNDSTIKLMPDLNHMYKWYYSNVDKSKNAKDDSLKTIVEEITKNDSTELQKVESVFNWVQNNIEYVAIEYGSGGIIPREAGLVYQRRYGDCKDMSCLTHKMLKSIDIETNLTWIGTRRIPFKYSEIPSPLIDNHMICTYQSADSTYFLDATDPTVPFGAPTTMIQTKEALLEQGPDKFEIKKVPAMPAGFSGKKDSCILKIEDKALVGDCICNYKGYSGAGIRYNLANKKGKDLDKYIEAILKKGGNKFYVENYTISNQENNNAPLVIKYNFRLEDYVQQVNNEQYVNLNLIKPLKSGKFDTDEFLYDYNGRFAYETEEINVLQLNQNTSVNYVPENNSNYQKDYSYDIKYNSTNQSISLHNKVVIDFLIFPKERYEEYNKVIAEINKDYSETLLLKTTTNEK